MKLEERIKDSLGGLMWQIITTSHTLDAALGEIKQLKEKIRDAKIYSSTPEMEGSQE